MPAKLTTEQFVIRANLKHNNKYDYSETVYVGAHTKIKISCPIHGIFEQSPNSHLSGNGCAKCGIESQATIMSAKAKAEFVQKAQETHGNRYDYSLVEYKNSYTKIKIICPDHGVFEQTPAHHINGSVCQICSYESIAKNRVTKAASEFVSKSREIHGDKYIYDLVEYKNNSTKIKIVCPEHGIFEQIPNSHLSGQGCAKCALSEKGWTRSKFKDKCDKNNNGLGILYVLECFNDSESFIKIGITSRSIKERYHSKTSMPYAYRVIDEIVGDPEYIFDLETEMHQQHKEHQYLPNIPFGGSLTECFNTYTC